MYIDHPALKEPEKTCRIVKGKGVAEKKGTTRKSPSKKTGSRKGESRKSKRSHLTKKELEHYKKMLLAKREALLDDIRGMQQENARQGGSGMKDDLVAGDLGDMSTAASMMETGAEFLDRQTRLLEDIEDALKRIEDGTYGYCLATGKPISKARLQVIPWAKYCTEYAQSLEKSRNRIVR